MSDKNKLMDAIRRKCGMINKVALMKAIGALTAICVLGLLGFIFPIVFTVLATLFLLGVIIMVLYALFDDNGENIW